jgi:hypothetical protein
MLAGILELSGLFDSGRIEFAAVFYGVPIFVTALVLGRRLGPVGPRWSAIEIRVTDSEVLPKMEIISVAIGRVLAPRGTERPRKWIRTPTRGSSWGEVVTYQYKNTGDVECCYIRSRSLLPLNIQNGQINRSNIKRIGRLMTEMLSCVSG